MFEPDTQSGFLICVKICYNVSGGTKVRIVRMYELSSFWWYECANRTNVRIIKFLVVRMCESYECTNYQVFGGTNVRIVRMYELS